MHVLRSFVVLPLIYRARCVHSVQAFASFISQPPEAATAADSFSLKRTSCAKRARRSDVPT
jgi:hypothetical protein